MITDYEKTGLLYVDMVAACVTHYRRHWMKQQRPLKTIYLSPKAYVQFTDWVRWNLETEGRQEQAEANIEQYTFDGVEVRMNSTLMGEKMYFDFYDKEVAQA